MKQLRNLLFFVFFLITQSNIFAQNAIVHVYKENGNVDYSPIIQQGIITLISKGGGTLFIHGDNYPVLAGIHAESNLLNLVINIVGIKGVNGKFPTLIDTNKSNKPHPFIYFNGNGADPTQKVNIMNVNITGNDFPYYEKHPFYGDGAMPIPAIRLVNIRSAKIENVIIRNVYGDGISLINGYDKGNDKKYRIESPIIRNCKILNCWSWNGRNDGGDGIMLWYVNNALIEKCTILNDLDVTKHYSRAGIVMEHKTENITVRNCKIGGYQRNIHIEGTYGGHTIQSNTFTQSANALTLNDWDWENSNASMYKPIKFIQNTISYTPNDGIIKRFAEYSFISGIMNGKNLSDVIIEKNSFTYNVPSNISATTKTRLKNPQNKQNFYIAVDQKNGYSKMKTETNIFK